MNPTTNSDESVDYEVTFSEPVFFHETSGSSADVIVNTTLASGAAEPVISGGPIIYNVRVSKVDRDDVGDIGITLTQNFFDYGSFTLTSPVVSANYNSLPVVLDQFLVE